MQTGQNESGRRCAICEETIPADQPGVRQLVIRWPTRRQRNGRWANEVVCQACTDQRSPNSEDGLRTMARAVWTPDLELVNCEVCGLQVFLQPDSRRRRNLCSDACRRRFYRERQPVTARETNSCEVCGTTMPGRSDRRYCSSACRQRAYRSRSSA